MASLPQILTILEKNIKSRMCKINIFQSLNPNHPKVEVDFCKFVTNVGPGWALLMRSIKNNDVTRTYVISPCCRGAFSN